MMQLLLHGILRCGGPSLGGAGGMRWCIQFTDGNGQGISDEWPQGGYHNSAM